MLPRYLQYLSTDFRQTFVIGASWVKYEMIRFWGHKVKGQGHLTFDLSRRCPVLDATIEFSFLDDWFSNQSISWLLKRWKEHIALQSSWDQSHHRAMRRHLPYGITQCYLPPDTSEHASPYPQPVSWKLIYLP